MQSAVCSLQSAVCSLQSAVCSLQSAVCGLRSAVCSLQMSYTGWSSIFEFRQWRHCNVSDGDEGLPMFTDNFRNRLVVVQESQNIDNFPHPRDFQVEIYFTIT